MTRREFEKVVKEALDALPDLFRTRLANVEMVVRESPAPRQSRRHGGRGTLLFGLYEGIPIGEKSVEQSGTVPDRITLFKRPMERACRTREALIRCIQVTVLHEVGHHFGFTDDQLEKMGYG